MQQHFSIWRMMHPDFLTAGSDKYYEELQKNINDRLLKLDSLDKLFEREIICEFVSKMSAGYLEDKASGFGVWDAFISLNAKRYKKKLPFFNPGRGYDIETINFEDIEFIVWMVISMVFKSERLILSPLSPFVKLMAVVVYSMLSDVWESAPEAIRIKEYIDSHLSSDDWLQQRVLAQWLTLNCYLTSVPDLLDAIQSSEINNGIEKDLNQYSMRARVAVKSNLRPLGLTAPEYLEEMSRNAGYRKISRLWNKLKVYDMAGYKVDKITDDSILVTAEVRYSNDAPLIGEKFSVVMESMSPEAHNRITEGSYILASFVKWNDRILLNGMLTVYPELDKEYSKYFHQYTPESLKVVEEKARRYVELNNNDRFAYFKDWDELYDFFDVTTESRKSDRKAPLKGNGLTCYISENFTNSISFISGSCLKDPNNPFYDKDEASKPGRIMSLIISPDGLSYEAAMYAAKHGMLADGSLATDTTSAAAKNIFEDDLYFWIDFYHSQLQ